MKNRFKVGDIVICVDADLSRESSYREGRIYEVTKAFQSGAYRGEPYYRVDTIDLETGHKNGWGEDHFESYHEVKFKENLDKLVNE